MVVIWQLNEFVVAILFIKIITISMIRSIKNFYQGLIFFTILYYFFSVSAFAQISRDNENLGQDLESLGLDNVENKANFVKPLTVRKNKKTKKIVQKKSKKKFNSYFFQQEKS